MIYATIRSAPGWLSLFVSGVTSHTDDEVMHVRKALSHAGNQIFLPLEYGSGEAIPQAVFDVLKQELSEKFGGVTAYTRAPADGLWRSAKGIERDTVIIFEVMAPRLEKDWWREFKSRLEMLLGQEQVAIRAMHATRI